MKPKRKILRLLLAICLVVGLLPTAAFAADSDKTIMLGASGMKDPTENTDTKGKFYTPNGYIYFGVNGSDPIKWRVLDADSANDNHTDGMFLLSEYLLESGVYFQQSYHLGSDNYTEHKGRAPSDGDHSNCQMANDWQGSDAQAWCENFASNSSNFSTAEQSAMLGVAKTDRDERLYKINWGESRLTTDDKMFFLSLQELANYIGDYDSAPGLTATFVDGSADMWCSRSPYAHTAIDVGVVHDNGIVKIRYTYLALASRPAFNLDLNSLIFTSAAVGGKSASGMDSELTAVDNYDGNEWKLTLLDESRSFAISDLVMNSSGDKLAFFYSGAQTGENEYISAVIEDNGVITHYGRILQLDGTTNGTNGTVSLTLPAGITLDNDTKLYVFNEQYNGGKNDDTKLTDYGSKPIEVDTIAPTLSNGNATRTSETTATVKFTSDEAGSYYYAVVESGAEEPTIDTTGEGTACNSGENSISLTTLSGMGAKELYIVAKDAMGNVSDTLKISIPVIYTLTVNLNGGNGATTDGEYIEDKEISIDAGIKSGYRFTGWTSSNGGTFADASSASTIFTMPANDTTITANWKKEPSVISLPYSYAVTFDTNGGKDMDKLVKEEYTRIDLDDYVPEKEGYKFVGWYADEDMTKEIDEVYLTKNITVYAKWEKIEEGIKTPETTSFTDVQKSYWFYDAVSYAVGNGIMSGMGDGTFSPNTHLTREMMAVILWNLEDNPESKDVAPFLDVTSDKYYANAIAWASENGIVAGYGDTFGVGDFITREQFAVMLHNYAQYQCYDVSVGENINILSYTDAFDISDYAYPAMQWACGAGIINGMGDGTLAPQGQTTRAEAATMLMNFCENIV